MNSISQADVERAKEAALPTENSRLLGISLGSSLDDITEAGRAFVAISQLTQQLQEVVEQEARLQDEKDKEGWIKTQEIKIGLCGSFYILCLYVAASKNGMRISEGSELGAVFQNGFFQATILSPLKDESSEELDVTFTPER
ncbi:MAG TPA: hypothetical protein VHD55_00055 [Candidatus Paceibacterota bacterium]|nr:hypothetical protein [Candidatus Paceibacterota bacterium]